MDGKQEIVVSMPVLFGNFREQTTRRQRFMVKWNAVKFAVKWVVNWKGVRSS